MRAFAVTAVLWLASCACGDGVTVGTGNGGGVAGSGGSGGQGGSSGGSGGAGGGASSGCSDDAKTVYVLGLDQTFSAFDPRTKTFRDIGVLSCPAMGGATPFSMAVARDANAYVLYDSGELFEVATSSLACTKTVFAKTAEFARFGMGFSTDAPGGTTDTLFIAGGLMLSPMSKLARLDLGTFTVGSAVDVVGWPELTGTGDAQLWGFFPTTALGGMPHVARLDKATGTFMTDYPASDLDGLGDAWAFAFWGGSFWIFLKRDIDPSTQVWEMKAGTGAVSKALSDTGRTIVGAGVSTCAPITIN